MNATNLSLIACTSSPHPWSNHNASLSLVTWSHKSHSLTCKRESIKIKCFNDTIVIFLKEKRNTWWKSKIVFERILAVSMTSFFTAIFRFCAMLGVIETQLETHTHAHRHHSQNRKIISTIPTAETAPLTDARGKEITAASEQPSISKRGIRHALVPRLRVTSAPNL